VQHRELVGLLTAQLVDDVEGKVEPVGIGEVQRGGRAVLVDVGADERVAHEAVFLLGRLAREDVVGLFRLRVGHDDREKQAVLPVQGDHAVRDGAAVEDRVALVQHFLMLADADLERALEHEVEFLSGVGRRVDGLVLQVLGILVGDPVGRGQLLAEHRREILDDDAVLLGRGETFAAARDRIARELG